MRDFDASIKKREKDLIALSREIWQAAELRFDTKKSADALQIFLEKEGFELQRGVAGMDHAFIARYGQGDLKVGFLAEYDALANMSQKSQAYRKQQDPSMSSGHACGHNLLGVGSLAAALILKDHLRDENQASIYLYGCPAEESGYGKAFMAREGCFDDLDFALTWHPYDLTAVWGQRTLAVYQIYFHFKGQAAHASSSPEMGRSALDAAELMNIGVNFLREHMDDQARIHYAFLDAGGESANVVQSEALLHYFIRHTSQEKTQKLYERVVKIAQGAALMTETEVEVIWDAACADFLANKKLSERMYQHAKEIDFGFDAADYRHAGKYRTNRKDDFFMQRIKNFYPHASSQDIESMISQPIQTKLADFKIWDQGLASTDVGDVSWNTPTAQMFVTSEVFGTQMHSWEWVDNGISDFAHKGMFAAGKIMAHTALDAIEDPKFLREIQDEFKTMTKNKKYESAIPWETKPGKGVEN